jgi:PhoD-like phosphatase
VNRPSTCSAWNRSPPPATPEGHEAAPDTACVGGGMVVRPPNRDYWYRFKTGSYVSPAGRARTAPPPGRWARCHSVRVVRELRDGLLHRVPSYGRRPPDLTLHLADYQYEGRGNPEASAMSPDRRRSLWPTTASGMPSTRRTRTLQAAHAAAPWLVVWDDHELDNNWADEVPETRSPTSWCPTMEAQPCDASGTGAAGDVSSGSRGPWVGGVTRQPPTALRCRHGWRWRGFYRPR